MKEIRFDSGIKDRKSNKQLEDEEKESIIYFFSRIVSASCMDNWGLWTFGRFSYCFLRFEDESVVEEDVEDEGIITRGFAWTIGKR